jgi:hypothetical protein
VLEVDAYTEHVAVQPPWVAAQPLRALPEDDDGDQHEHDAEHTADPRQAAAAGPRDDARSCRDGGPHRA